MIASEVFTFFPLLAERPKFSVLFDWITSDRIPLKRKRNICWCLIFFKSYNAILFLFSVRKKYRYHLTANFNQSFRTNGKNSRLRKANMAALTSAVNQQKQTDLF